MYLLPREFAPRMFRLHCTSLNAKNVTDMWTLLEQLLLAVHQVCIVGGSRYFRRAGYTLLFGPCHFSAQEPFQLHRGVTL
jgi:hypothetical protein